MIFLKDDQISEEDWNRLLKACLFLSPFQTPYFYHLINEIPGFSAHAYAISDGLDISALCLVTIQKEPGIKGFLSKRAIVYGGPILLSLEKDFLDLLLPFITEDLKGKTIYLEIRNYFDYNTFKSVYQFRDFRWLPYLDIRLKLSGKKLDEVISGMKYNRRREIKLSFQAGASYRETESSSEIEQVYNILKSLYRNKVKLPIPNLSFFKTIFNSQIGKTFAVIHDGKIIGGSFCLFYSNSGIYTMYYCGIRGYNIRIFPTHLAVLAAIDYGMRNNLGYIDFMGAGRRDKEYGVRKYKQEFGGDLTEYGRYLRINKRIMYFLGNAGLNILKIVK